MKQEREDAAVKGLQTLHRRLLIPGEVALFGTLGIVAAATLLYATTLYPEDALILSLSALVFLLAPLAMWLTYYARGRNALRAQSWFAILGVFAFLLAAAINVVLGAWIPVALSVLAAAFVVFVYRKKKASWTHTSSPVPLVFFRGAISKSYWTNLLTIEIVFGSLLLAGVASWQLRGWDNWALLPMVFGTFGVLAGPIWAATAPPPGFLQKDAKALKGAAVPGERFLGAVYGIRFEGRPRIQMESVDNALFVTNARLLIVTVPGLRMGPGVEDSSPFFKTSAYHFLKEAGDAHLTQEPQAVLAAHEFNFALPWNEVESVKVRSGLLLKAAAINVLSVKTKDGTYRFFVHYPDELEHLRTLLNQAVPHKFQSDAPRTA